MGDKRALYVGIGSYRHHSALLAAPEDARSIAKALEFDATDEVNPPRNWPGGQRALLVSDTRHPFISQDDLDGRLDTLLNAARGDDILLYFAGHGAVTESGLLLATSDDDPHGTRAGVTVDALMARLVDAQVNSATIFLDCCGAGSATESQLPRNVVVIAGAGATQQAKEFGGRGQFTGILLDGLRGGAANTLGVITALSLYTYAAGVLSYIHGQEPVIHARLEELIVLKRVRGQTTLSDLRHLAPQGDLKGMFATPESKNTLTPDHEATEEQSEPPPRSRPHRMRVSLTREQIDMDYYKRLRNAGLLETVDGGDLFWTCMHGGQVQLTALGRYYWDLADQGLI